MWRSASVLDAGDVTHREPTAATDPSDPRRRSRRALVVPLFAVAGLAACSSDAVQVVIEIDDTTTTTAPPTTTSAPTTTSTEAPPIIDPADGVWEIVGYGYHVEIRDGRQGLAHLVAGPGCVSLPFAELDDLVVDGDTATATIDDAAYVLDRVALPDACADPAEPDARLLAESFVGLFDTHYPFFAERGIDWEPRAEEILELGGADDLEPLLLAMAELVRDLDDGHTAIDLGLPPTAEAIAELAALEADVEAGRRDATERLGELTAGPYGILEWARTDDGIGYLRIARLAGFEAVDPDDLDAAADRAAIADSLDLALTDLADASSIIIDLRGNPGGTDSVSLEVVSRFVPEARDLYTEESFAAPERTRVTIAVEPSDRVRSDAPVFVLVDPLTASAAEVLGAGLLAGADATVIGPGSEGILSDTVPFVLPGGVEVQLSMEVYRLVDGTALEVVGVPVQIETSSVDALAVALDRARR